ncbi:uroporphyrinogen-III synthase [Salinicoccus sp. CNSTN-B1]
MSHYKPIVVTTQSRTPTVHSDLMELVHLPLITVEPFTLDESVFEETYDWLLLTSPNAVEFFMPYIDRVDWKKIATIGRKTSEALEERGYHVDFEPTEYTQEGFMAEFEAKKGERLLYPVSKNARPLIYKHLLKAGCQVDRHFLYHPVENDKSLKGMRTRLKEDLFAVIFLSPSGVRAFQKHFSAFELDGVLAIAIGHVTATALMEFGIEPVQPEKATMESIMNLLENRIDWRAKDEF